MNHVKVSYVNWFISLKENASGSNIFIINNLNKYISRIYILSFKNRHLVILTNVGVYSTESLAGYFGFNIINNYFR